MSLIKSKKTNKRFYNKWLYKISIRLEGAAVFRVYSLDELKEISTNPNSIKWIPEYVTDSLKKNPNCFNDLIEFLSSADSSTWSKRIESSCIDLYTNDKLFYDQASVKFQDKIIQRFEPDETSIDALDGGNTILGKKLPHGKYNFRVYLLPHKLAGDRESKKKYISWLKTQVPRVTVSSAIEAWFLKTDWNWDRRYILVEDDKTLLMLKLRNPEVMGRVYNYCVSDK